MKCLLRVSEVVRPRVFRCQGRRDPWFPAVLSGAPESPKQPQEPSREASLRVPSLQSCPTLCSPMDGSQPGSSVHGILQEEYWSGFPRLPPEDLLNQGSDPRLLHLLNFRQIFHWASWEATKFVINHENHIRVSDLLFNFSVESITFFKPLQL